MDEDIWTHTDGDGPIVACAIHAGRRIRGDVSSLMRLPGSIRFREEDPFTDRWTSVVPARIVATHTRFQVDLNRPRESAVYLEPEHAWGLDVWFERPARHVVERSLSEYDAFYGFLAELLRQKEREHGRFVVLDIHSYNHRRDGPFAPPASEDENPMVNVGTGNMPRTTWARLVDRFIDDLGSYDFPNARLDVRENVRFEGGAMSRWIHENFPESGCVLALEFKKFFMDEWTGEPEWATIEAIEKALSSTVPGLLEELERM